MEAKFKIDDAIKFTATVENKYTIGDEGRIDVDGVFERNGNYFYNVKSAGHLITDVPESDMDFVYSSVEKNVDEYLRKREEGKSFKDSDVRVSGSRKEMMAFKGMINSEDLENIEKDKVIAKKLIKKDKVYPEINTSEQIDKGVSGGCLFLKMKARDFVWQTPPDTSEFRALYVGLSQWVYELFDDAITITDFEERRKLFVNGIIRKAILISNPEIENELVLQNNEYQQEALKLNEYRDKYNLAHEKIYELARKEGVPTWDYSKMEEAFPDTHKELVYWKKLKNIADQFGDNKILPLEYRFLHNLAVVQESGEKTSLLTGKDLPQGDYGKSKQIDDEYIINYSGTVRTKLIESVFGEKFSYFIRKTYRKSDNEAPYKVYEEAKKYEAFTQEEYDKIYESQIKPVEETILKYSTHISFLNDPEKTYREKVDYALRETDIGGWFWTNNKKMNFRKMVQRDRIDDAIRLMNSVISKPDSGYHMKVKENELKLEQLKEKYNVRENNYVFLEKGKDRKKGERSELVINSGVPLSYIKRIGGVAVFDTDLDTNDKVLSFYKNILGITRITYGLSLPDKERMAHSKHFAQSVIDLAETLNWDVKALTGLGDLGILFAAAGHGRAMAHFSPSTNAVNLTRSKGDGSVCHELGHYIDFNVALKYKGDGRSEKNHAVYGSYVHSGARNISNNNIMMAMQSLMNFIVDGVYVRNNEFDDTRINKEHPVIQKMLPLLPEFVQQVISSSVTIKVDKNNKTTTFGKFDTIDGYIKYLKDNLPKYLNYNYYLTNKTGVLDTLGAIVNDLKMDSYEFQLSNKPYSQHGVINNKSQTAFYLKNKAMKSVYWTFYWELFARGFECYVFDKMAKSGKSNNYLVSGAYFDRPEGVYPFGVEREILFILYDNLYDVIKSEMTIPDFKAFRDERVDEYVELGDNDEEEESLVIDEKTKEIISGDEELMKQKEIAIQKMIKLKELLSKKSDENFKHGGQINVSEHKLIENLFRFSK